LRRDDEGRQPTYTTTNETTHLSSHHHRPFIINNQNLR
jgi:hypothetical protein